MHTYKRELPPSPTRLSSALKMKQARAPCITRCRLFSVTIPYWFKGCPSKHFPTGSTDVPAKHSSTGSTGVLQNISLLVQQMSCKKFFYWFNRCPAKHSPTGSTGVPQNIPLLSRNLLPFIIQFCS